MPELTRETPEGKTESTKVYVASSPTISSAYAVIVHGGIYFATTCRKTYNNKIYWASALILHGGTCKSTLDRCKSWPQPTGGKVRPADIPDAPTRRGWVSTTVSPYFDAIRARVPTLEVTWKPSRHHRTPPTTGPTTEPNNQPTEPAEPTRPNTDEPTDRPDPKSRSASHMHV